MTSRVEIFEIKRIICDLLNSSRCEVLSADLKLDYKNDAAEQYDGISSLPHSRNRKLKGKPTLGDTAKALAKKLDLLQPSHFFCQL